MPQMNKVLLIGNLTRDPELRRLSDGSSTVDLVLALNRKYLGKGGQEVEEVTFVNVTAWEGQAEACAQHLKKGSPVHVEGWLKMDEWQDKATGEKRSKLKVRADRIQFLDRRKEAR
jgi:single-strand DNA-binding protein